MGHRRYVEGYDRASKWYNEKQRGTVLGSEATSLSPCRMSYNPPRPIALSHRITYVHTLQSCHGAVVAPLSEVPQEGSAVFSLFSLIKLHLASHQLARRYIRVAVSSKKCCLNFFCSPPCRLGKLKQKCKLIKYLEGRSLTYIYILYVCSQHLQQSIDHLSILLVVS